VLDSLEVDARGLGDHAELDVTGRETGGRLLVISARGTKELAAFGASIQAANFDLAPLAAFAPGQLRGGRGTLNAALTIKGLDPKTGEMRGMLQIKDGRLPLSPELGTLRRATLDVKIIKHKITAEFDGRLGAGGGSIKGTVGAELVGGMPMRATLDAKVRKVQPIGAVQPQLDADVTGTFVNEGARWTGKVVVDKAKVFVPQEAGNELLGTGAPADMIFVDATTVARKPRHEAEKPWLVTRIEIKPTDVIVDDSDVRVRLVARGRLDVEVGQGLTVNGTIRTTTGTVDVLGRRYRLEQGIVDFDGSLDPRLDIRMVHDFKNLTLTVDVRGRVSEPDPHMSGDPGTYTDGQLLSFFAGAEPGNEDSATQANDAVVGGSLTILSSRVGRRINKHLPVKFDAINYEAATAASSRAVRFGLRLSEKSYLVWRQRLEARPDENPGEVVFEYQIRPNMLFETTVGERAAGGDFLLRTRW
jgi:translocation and assembly module TamB